MRKANVYLGSQYVGQLEELDRGHRFTYDEEYLKSEEPEPVSLTLPIRAEPYETERELHPFFDGLIPEGWLLQLALGVHKLELRDRFGLLLATGTDPIGAARIIAEE